MRLTGIIRSAWIDTVLGLAGLAWGVGSLSYPFGHDQGVHYYVAREWVLRGAIPYRDTFDYKTPGIFLLHALVIALGGEGLVPIRVAELACVLVLGWVVARIAVRDGPAPRGAIGLGVLATSLLYYGYFFFWDTAQCEIWAAALAFGGILAALRVTRWGTACAVAGALGGLSLLMKPPAAPLVAVIAVLLLRRSPRRAVAFLVFVLALAAPAAMVVAYFAWKHALGDLADVLFGAVPQYLVGTRGVDSLRGLWNQLSDIFGWFNPLSSILLGMAWAWWVARRSPGAARAYRLELSVLAAAYLGVAMQLKFYHYHWVLLTAPLALLVVRAVVSMARQASRPVRVLVGSAACLLAAYGVSGPPVREWTRTTGLAVQLWTGSLTRADFASNYSVPGLRYSDGDSEAAAAWLREHSSREDLVAVRGFETEIYALARRRAPGRFFWTLPITDPHRGYRREEWLAEDRRALERASPRFVVALRDTHSGPDAAETFLALGYQERTTFGRLTILERAGL